MAKKKWAKPLLTILTHGDQVQVLETCKTGIVVPSRPGPNYSSCSLNVSGACGPTYPYRGCARHDVCDDFEFNAGGNPIRHRCACMNFTAS